MPAGLFDEAEGGPTQPPNGGQSVLDTPGNFLNPEQKAGQMRDVFAQIMAARQGISPPPGPAPTEENLWAAQGQAQLGAPPPEQFPTPPGGGGATVPSMQAQPPMPGMNFPMASPGPGAPGGPMPPDTPFPGAKKVTTGGEGGGGPGGGAYGLPPTLGRRALR